MPTSSLYAGTTTATAGRYGPVLTRRRTRRRWCAASVTSSRARAATRTPMSSSTIAKAVVSALGSRSPRGRRSRELCKKESKGVYGHRIEHGYGKLKQGGALRLRLLAEQHVAEGGVD